jgi:hypothetical protein
MFEKVQNEKNITLKSDIKMDVVCQIFNIFSFIYRYNFPVAKKSYRIVYRRSNLISLA